MELILWLLVSYYLANNLFTNAAYAVRGLDPPRHKERMARIQAGGDPSSRYQSGRHGASRFFAEAWHDAWDDAHTKRQELRDKRKAKKAAKDSAQPEPTETAEPQVQPDGDLDTPDALRPQEPAEPTDNVIPLAGRARRSASAGGESAGAGGGSATATISRPAATDAEADRSGPKVDVATPGPPQPDGVLDTPDALHPQPGQTPGTADPTVSPDMPDAVDDLPRPMAEPGTSVHGGPSPYEFDRGGLPPGARWVDSYPTLHATEEAGVAYEATLDAETRRTLAALAARLDAAGGDAIPITASEQAAVIQARGYPAHVAWQAAEDLREEARHSGGTLMVQARPPGWVKATAATGRAPTPVPPDAPAGESAAPEPVEYTDCEHCTADDGPGGTVRHRPDLNPPGDVCDECYGRRKAAEADPDGPANETVICPRCGEDRRRYDMDYVRLHGDAPELVCPDCINCAGVRRPRRYTDTDPTAEWPGWPAADVATPPPLHTAGSGPVDPAPQPDSTVEIPEALRPSPDTPTAAGADGGNEGPAVRERGDDQPARPTRDDPYPSLFTTAEEWDAHLETLAPETRRTYEALQARIAAARGSGVPVTIAESAALFQARGYPPDVAQQAAEHLHAEARRRGVAVMMGGPRPLPGEKAVRRSPDRSEHPHEQPTADGDGAAPLKESQEGNRMSVMTSNNAASSAAGQPTGETAGLGSAIRFAAGMADSMRDAAARTETSIASLTGSEVGEGPLAVLQQAMEAATNAAAAYEAAQAELQKQVSVKEAYDATPDAGNKRFLQGD